MKNGIKVKFIGQGGTRYKLVTVDDVSDKSVHFKEIGLSVNKGEVKPLLKPFRGATYVYHSFNPLAKQLTL